MGRYVTNPVRLFSKKKTETNLGGIYISYLHNLYSNKEFGVKYSNPSIKTYSGNFNDWKFWQHEGDIDFEKIKSKEHFNIMMFNTEAINSDSLSKYLHAKSKNPEPNQNELYESKTLDKLLDLLVIDGFLLEDSNKLRMKILTINNQV